MRSWLFLFGILLLLSCNNNEHATGDIQEDTVMADENEYIADRLTWISEYDTLKNEFYLKKQRTGNNDTLTAGNVINDINAVWENVQLVFSKVSHDTVYVSIPDSDFLIQQMGSAGAEAYIASVTYNLTELKGIKFINYDFEAGDHLSPGVFSRKDFVNYH
jgi:hypothetical protein